MTWKPYDPCDAPGAEKKCSRCGVVQPLDQFYKDRRASHGYYSQCKACHRKANAVTHAKNRDLHRPARRRWRQENRDKVNAGCKDWRERNAAYDRERHKKWEQDNPDKAREQWFRARSNRRARLAGVEVVRVDRREIFERDGGICHICSAPVAWGQFDLDHVVPIALGGAHTPENVAVSHASCNRSKGARV